MEFVETIARSKNDDDEVEVHLVTIEDEFKGYEQNDYFQGIQDTCQNIGIKFDWEFVEIGTQHARHVVTDTGWKILLDRGLDIFQPYDMNDAFSISNRLQQYRNCKAFEITYIRIEDTVVTDP